MLWSMFLFARILHGFFNGREEEENPKDVFACTVVQGRAGQDGGLDAVLPGERRPGARSDEGFFQGSCKGSGSFKGSCKGSGSFTGSFKGTIV